MNIDTDLHSHSSYCDGSASPEEMVLSAIAKGLKTFGICAHSYVSFDTEYCMPREKYDEFKSEIARLREKYKDRIEILCGIEQDYFSDFPAEGFDYIIGSVHYLRTDEGYVTVDGSPELLEKACNEHFSGDYYALCEEYFRLVSDVVNKTKCDIIGHFDLVCKFNEKHHFFDESDPRYIAAAQRAADCLIAAGKPFEINTGAVSRGYKTCPYPSATLREYISSKNGSFVYGSDAHSPESIALIRL